MTDTTTLPRRRWDPIVRITHWSIALAVLANAVVTEDGSGPHIWVGYGLAAILALRLLWGLVGPAEARFSAFWPSTRKAIAHLRDIRAGSRHSARTARTGLCKGGGRFPIRLGSAISGGIDSPASWLIGATKHPISRV